MHLRILLAAACAALAICCVPASASAATCKAPKYPGDGYFTSLKVSGVSCAKGRELAVAYYRCRIRAGGIKGRCTSRVLRYSCTEKRQSIPTQINARVTCKRGRATVIHTYQQNT